METCLRACNFYYRVNAEEAERLINQYGENGDFLARYSGSQPENFSLTIKREGGTMHIKVQKYDELLSVFGKGPEMFRSLVELLEFYIQNPEKLKEKERGVVKIIKPIYIPYEVEKCALEQAIVQVNRWFHSNLTALEANQILEKERAGTFLVRFSQHLPGALVISAKADNSVVHLNVRQNPQTGKYTIDGDNTEYCDIVQLLATYTKNPIVEKAGSSRVVYLEHPMTAQSTFVPAELVADRYELLKKPVDISNTQKTGITEEFERLQSEQGPAELYFSKREGRREINVDKNRYKNIVPFDHTRVILRERGNSETDYINASYVKFNKPKHPLTLAPTRSYIATQGCMEHTMKDFWHMVWQENTRVIVMPTRENERKEKCMRYWPELSLSGDYGDVKVKTISEVSVKKEVPDDLKDQVEQMEIEEVSYIVRKFSVTKGVSSPREIRHLQFVSWPDHGCPFHPHEVISFLDAVDEAHVHFEQYPIEQGPIVVHCSAGIGRTGTFMLLDVLLTQIKQKGRGCPIDIWRTARHARDYRGGLVQTDQQYGFLYNAVGYYMKKTNKREVLRLVEPKSRLPIHPMTNQCKTTIKVPDQALAFISKSPSASPRLKPTPRTRSRTSPRTGSSSGQSLSPNNVSSNNNVPRNK